MWKEKKIGVRQHHCRVCGKALCDKCSDSRTTIPKLGFELIPVRTCSECFNSISEADKTSMITFFDLNRAVRVVIICTKVTSVLQCTSVSLDMDVLRLATVNKNKSISLFDVSEQIRT